MPALYNEHDEFAADWLENLIRADLIAPGVVDRRSIVDLTPDDLLRYDQVHLFAGIGIWSAALRDAGVRDNEPWWTASCPCQPFSAAGQGGGFDDERHLWPAAFHLIEQCKPFRIVGEQVASKDGLAWLDLVQADMEGAGYAFGAVDTCAAGFGAPHIRQRLYWLAEASHEQLDGRRDAGPWRRIEYSDGSAIGLVANADDTRSQGRLGMLERADKRAVGPAGVMADSDGGDASAEGLQRSGQHGQRAQDSLSVRPRDRGIGDNAGPELDRPRATNDFWRDADWLLCRDGRWRPVEPGTFPLATGQRSRVGRLRAYGNQIVRPQAAAFIRASIEAIEG